MSQETRKQQRQQKKNSRNRIIILVAFVLAVLVVIDLIRDQQNILEKTTWTKETNATFYFFKAVNDAEVDGFNVKTITVEPGGKTNGYTELASQELCVNTNWAERQSLILQSLIDRNAPENWEAIVQQTILAGEDTIVIDLEKVSLSEIAPYVGYTMEDLAAKLEVMINFAQGNPLRINLDNLDLIRSGAVYTGTTNRRRVLNENFLPYMDTDLLKAIDRTDKASQNALTVIGNDHIFAVTVLNAKTEIDGEARAIALKADNLSATGISETDYYDMLTSRDDLVRQYPVLDMTMDGEVTEMYLVDCKTEDQKKLLVFMIKNDTARFLKEEKADGKLEIQSATGYVVPKSAVKNVNDGSGTLTLMDKTYFPEEVTVKIGYQDGSKYILSASENEELTEGDIYKVFP